MNFDLAFEKLIGHEGGYVNDPKDPGGETKFGISKRAYPKLDIKALTMTSAANIYLTDYWIPAGCELVPEAVRYDLFDAAVNSGIRQAIIWLQQAAGTSVDGSIGPKTKAAIGSADGAELHAKFNGYRLKFMTDLTTWDRFGKGWARRIAANLINV